MKTNLIVRSLTGIIFVIVLVGGILWSPTSFGLLFTIITGMTVWEFCTIINKNEGTQVNRLITTVAGVYLFFAVLGFNRNIVGAEIFIPYLVSIIYLLISELYFDRAKSIYNWAFSLMAQRYIALPFSLLNVLSYVVSRDSYTLEYNVVYTPTLVLSVFIYLWASDTGAYCFGSMLGKHKLFPRISPNKTWEGSIGGGITAIIASQIIAYFCKDFYYGNDTVNAIAWGGLAIIVVIFGTWGDLAESLLKRKLGIKDSGNILPGHGGMLDRFDSSLIAIPAAVIYIYTLNIFGILENLAKLF